MSPCLGSEKGSATIMLTMLGFPTLGSYVGHPGILIHLNM